MPGLKARARFLDFGLLGFTSGSLPDSQDPIRAELFSAERLEQHAESVAAQRVLAEGGSPRPLSSRVRDSGRVLLRCYRELAAVIREEGAITPAAEWFVDNFHIVEERPARDPGGSPAGFYRRLPKLAEGPLEGYPRVLGLAWPFVAHTDSRFEPETLQRFVQRFQQVQVLTIGELWAVPIALRLVLLENLRRMAEQIVNSRAARRDADALANELLGLGGEPARRLAFQRLEAASLPMAFIVELVQRLREQDPESTPALAWLSEQLSGLGTSPEELVRQEHQRQAAMNVTVRNVITSMRTMSTFDWAEFFESVSLGRRRAPCGEQLRRDGLRDTRSVPSRHRGPRSRFPADGPRCRSGGDRASEAREVGAEASGHPGGVPSRGSWLLSDLEGTPAASNGRSATAYPSRSGCCEPTSAEPRRATSAPSALSRGCSCSFLSSPRMRRA